MLDIEQKYKDLFNTYGGKNIRLIFYNEDYNAIYPSESLYPSDELYPDDMDEVEIDFEITDDMVQSDTLIITESLCSDENLNFGSCECSQMEIIVSGLQQDISGREFLLTESFGDFELIRGIYRVDSTPKQEDKDTRKIIAYDRMRRFEVDVSGWYNRLEFPMTLKEFRTSLCDYVGVNEVENTLLVNDNVIIEKTIYPTTLNGRNVLQYICQLNGVFGHVNINGKLKYIALPKKNEVSETISVFKSAESEEYLVPDIDTVRIRQETGDIGGGSQGDGENIYVIEGNILSYGKTTSQINEIAENIKYVITSLEYRAASIVTNGAPWIEVGDRIVLQTNDGDINTIIMKRVSTGIQGAMDDYESTGTQERNNEFNFETEIIQIKGLSAILKRNVEEVSNNLKNLEKDTESKFLQTSEQISAKVSKGSISSELSIEPGDIEIKTDRLSWESSKSSMSKEGKIKAVDGEFSGDVVAKSFKTTDNSIVLQNGKLKITGAEINGTTNTSTIGANVIHANSIDVGNNLSVDGEIMTNGIYCNGYIYASEYYKTSDKRLKTKIISIDTKIAYQIISKLRPVSFSYINGKPSVGFIAQEVIEIMKSLNISIPLVGSDGIYFSIAYENYIPLLVGAFQYLNEKITRQEDDT